MKDSTEGEKKGEGESVTKHEESEKFDRTQGESMAQVEESKKVSKTQVSFRKIFRDSDFKDTWLMMLGTIGCVADGSSTPLIMLVLSQMMNTYAVDTSFTLKDINKDALTLIYLAIGVGLGAFLGTPFFHTSSSYYRTVE